MAKRKIAIAMSDWLVDEVDEYAGRIHMSRSAIVQEATAKYLSRARTDNEREQHRSRALHAMEDMRRMAAEHAAKAPDAPASLEILRELRAASGRRDKP